MNGSRKVTKRIYSTFFDWLNRLRSVILAPIERMA